MRDGRLYISVTDEQHWNLVRMLIRLGVMKDAEAFTTALDDYYIVEYTSSFH